MIKVGFCVAYDWELLKVSLPLVYQNSDLICLAVDKNRKSWAGKKYPFDDEAFYSFVREIDVSSKIDIYEDDFALPDLNSRQNCNRHRMMIADRMGKGGWHVQVDSDEYILDFEGLRSFLKNIESNPSGDDKTVNVLINAIPLYKKLPKGYLTVIFPNVYPEAFPIATNNPDYQRARHNDHFNYLSPFFSIHETWARGEEELEFKLNNWGHSSEELSELRKRESYLNLWRALDEFNYMKVRDIHAAKPEVWPALEYVAANNIAELLDHYKAKRLGISDFNLRIRNTKLHAKLRQLGWLK